VLCVRLTAPGCICVRILLEDAAASRLVPTFASQATYPPCVMTASVCRADNSLYGGWVVLTSATGVSRVPYMGYRAITPNWTSSTSLLCSATRPRMVRLLAYAPGMTDV